MKDVTAALMVRGSQIFIAKRQLGQHLESMWEFPGGKVEDGETAKECLARELKEEFGIEVQVGAFFMESIYHYERGAIRLLAYFAEHIDGDFVPTVHDDMKWVRFNELLPHGLAPADIPIAHSLITYFK